MKSQLQHFEYVLMGIAVYLFALFLMLYFPSTGSTAEYKLFSNNYLSVGNQWNYNLHVTKYEGSSVDFLGTSTKSITRTENIEGYDTSAVNVTWEIPGILNSEEVIYYNITQEFILQIRHEDDESYTTVRNNDPLEDYPIFVNDTDINQQVGHGEFIGNDKYPPYNTWYGSHDSYVTYLGKEMITVPAGDFDCIKILHYYDWRDEGPDYWQVYRKLWVEPNIGIIKEEVNDWNWENSEWLESVYTLELSSWYSGENIEITSINESFDTFLSTLTVTGRYHINHQPAIDAWIGADDPIGEVCDANFIQTDLFGNFTISWNTTNVKPGLYQIILFANGHETQISIPINKGIDLNSPSTYNSNIVLDYGQLKIPGQYYNPLTLSCSNISEDCRILKPTLNHVFEDIKTLSNFFYRGIGHSAVSAIKDPATYIAAIGGIACAATAGGGCGVWVAVEAIGYAKSLAVGFGKAAVENSNLYSNERLLAYEILSAVDNILYVGVATPGSGWGKVHEDAFKWLAEDEKSHIQFYYDNPLISGNGSLSANEPAGVYIVAKTKDGKVVAMTIFKQKEQNQSDQKAMPWIPLLLDD